MATNNIYFCSFFSRTIRLWNNLPAETVESNSLAVFYSKLLPYLVNNHWALLFYILIIYIIQLWNYYPNYFINFFWVLYIFISLYNNSWCDVCTDFTNLINADDDNICSERLPSVFQKKKSKKNEQSSKKCIILWKNNTDNRHEQKCILHASLATHNPLRAFH